VLSIEWQWIAAIGIPLFIGAIAVWWKVESRQDKKLDDLNRSNDKAHTRLHEKIDDVEDKRDEQHSHLRDKIEEIWKHVVKHK